MTLLDAILTAALWGGLTLIFAQNPQAAYFISNWRNHFRKVRTVG